NPELNVTVDAYIPETYIEDEKQKIDMYKRFHSLESKEEMEDLKEELIDRFGDYPHEVEKLFLVSYLKMIAKKERVESITEKGKRTELIVEEARSQQIDGTKLFELANSYGRNVQLGTVGNKLKVIFRWNNETEVERYQYIGTFIDELEKVNQEEDVSENDKTLRANKG